jgi:hypothetical protein
MAVLRAIIGLILGFGIAFGSYYGVAIAISRATSSLAVSPQPAASSHAKAPANRPNPKSKPKPQPTQSASQGNSTPTALIVGLVCGAFGGLYGTIAFAVGIYGLAPFSILGFILDVSWSLLNSVAALVWMLVCLIAGSDSVDPDDNSKRSGTFVYATNPRGGGYGATTIGTTIAGGWCSHEETHVWQARIFGPLYMQVYIVSLLFNLLFRLLTGNLDDISKQAYYRICFEDWAYAAGTTSGADISWGFWFLWFFLSALYVSFPVLFVAGFVAKLVVMSIVAGIGLLVYSLIRALLPPPQ